MITREELERIGWVHTGKTICEWYKLEGTFHPEWQNHSMYNIQMHTEVAKEWFKIEAQFGPGGEYEVIFDGRLKRLHELHIVMWLIGITSSYK